MVDVKRYVKWVITDNDFGKIPIPLRSLSRRIEKAIKFALSDYKKELEKQNERS